MKIFCVSDVPILHLSLGSNLNPDDIEEGDDVYFECKVNANPEAYKVLWKHNVSYNVHSYAISMHNSAQNNCQPRCLPELSYRKRDFV